jgi:hypothetical protein
MLQEIWRKKRRKKNDLPTNKTSFKHYKTESRNMVTIYMKLSWQNLASNAFNNMITPTVHKIMLTTNTM